MKKFIQQNRVNILGLAAAALGLLTFSLAFDACKAKHPVDHKDSVECAVFEGWPVQHDTDFEIEAVFIPVGQLDMYNTGAKVWIDSNGYVQDPLIRIATDDNANHREADTTGLEHVIIHERVMPNKYKKLY